MTMTIDTIVGDVTKELSKTPGKERVEKMDNLVERLNDRDLRVARASLRARAGITFSVNTTQAQSGRPTISVRAHGVDCGFLSFDEQAGRILRMFRPSERYMRHWTFEPALEWSDARVRQFVKVCVAEATDKYSSRESRVQELLFRAMKGGGSKKTALRGFQPVLFGRVPFQIPLPVTPRGGSKGLGKHKGHSDVLARSRKHGRLVVFEVKRPAASRRECIGALEQAVRYAAALDHLMSRDEHRAAYWRLLGSGRGPRDAPRFSAVAFLDEAGGARCRGGLRDKLDELLDGNGRKYGLSVMLYRKVRNGIEVLPSAGGITGVHPVF